MERICSQRKPILSFKENPFLDDKVYQVYLVPLKNSPKLEVR